MSKMEDDSAELLQLLRSGTGNRNVNLPRALRFYKKKGVWEIEMGSEQVIANLQTDIAAFEGWALAMKRWASLKEPGVEIRLRWSPPIKANDCSLDYERFLYRVIRFDEVVEWFKVARGCSEHLNSSKVLKRNGEPKRTGTQFLVNVPGKRTKPTGSKAGNALPTSERDIEVWFYYHPGKLLESVGWSGKLERQVPVGLFCGAINDGNRVFPGAGGKVDLAAIDSRKGVSLFELKKPQNVKVGAISELLFYAHVVRDIRNGLFEYRPEDTGGFKDAISSKGKVRGFVLANEIHPLLDKEAFGVLNKAFRGTGVEFGFICYNESLECCRVF